MGLVFFETDRFVVRQWELADMEELYRLMSDSRVHTYTGDSPWTIERTRSYIEYMLDKDFRTLELFHGACVLKQNHTIIGLTGLNPYIPKHPEIEWQFGAAFWGKGYATEIGKAVIKEAFRTTDIQVIYGMVNPQNKASMKVMDNIGMTCIGLHDFHGEQDMFYKIERTAQIAG